MRRCARMPTTHEERVETYKRNKARKKARLEANGGDSLWDVDMEIDLLRQACLMDFWTFFLYAFGAGTNPKGQRWIDRDVHGELAEWLQHHIDEWLADREKGSGRQKH